jgi:hypothetical protein
VTQDIVTHEFTHAVTRFRASFGGGLSYFWLAGALNESYSDVMAFLHTGDPRLAEGIPGREEGIRDLSDPTIFLDPNRYSDLRPLAVDPDEEFDPYDPTGIYKDNGGVHTNSGIPNHAAYLLARGGTHKSTGVAVIGIGDERAKQAYFHSMLKVSSSADFHMQRDAVLWAADLLSFSPAEKCSIRNAFAAVEVGGADVNCDGIVEPIDGDGDGVPDTQDNCPRVANPSQYDFDVDHIGDACDADADGDGLLPGADNCPLDANAGQEDFNFNGVGAVCDPTEDGDVDNDLVPDRFDNCPHDWNPSDLDPDIDRVGSQPDADRDGEGDACDPDGDGDGIGDNDDNCFGVKNQDQANADGDALGDACDPCPSASDTGVSYSSTVILTESGPVAVNKPIVPDADGDGRSDGCDDEFLIGGSTVSIDGPGGLVGLRPDAVSSEQDLVVSGTPGGTASLFVPLCVLFCQDEPPVDACVELRVSGLGVSTIPTVRDDLGSAVPARADGDRLLFRIEPRGGRTYELEFRLAGTGNVSDELSVGLSGCSPIQRPSPSAPAPTGPTVTVPPPTSEPVGPRPVPEACALVPRDLVESMFQEPIGDGRPVYTEQESQCEWLIAEVGRPLKQLLVYVYANPAVLPRSGVQDAVDLDVPGATEAFQDPQRNPRVVTVNLLIRGQRYILSYQSASGESADQMLPRLVEIARAIATG